jgi:hypothetical protein
MQTNLLLTKRMTNRQTPWGKTGGTECIYQAGNLVREVSIINAHTYLLPTRTIKHAKHRSLLEGLERLDVRGISATYVTSREVNGASQSETVLKELHKYCRYMRRLGTLPGAIAERGKEAAVGAISVAVVVSMISSPGLVRPAWTEDPGSTWGQTATNEGR